MNGQTWRQALDVQMGVWRWLQTDDGRRVLDALEAAGVRRAPEDSKDAERMLYRSELLRLEDAETIFVSDEMCDLVRVAAQSFKVESLAESDPPVPSGFVAFASPIDLDDLESETRPLKLAGFSWSTMPEFGLFLSLYAKTDPASWRLPIARPSVVLEGVLPWVFGEEYATAARALPNLGWARVAQVTFRLMQQRIAVAEREETPPRAQRREAQRLGFPASGTLVVRLRRASTSRDGRDEPGSANYSHRFIVGGHWRNQWYPASEMHRQIWIAPYVKGSDELPLVVSSRRVFVWDR